MRRVQTRLAIAVAGALFGVTIAVIGLCVAAGSTAPDPPERVGSSTARTPGPDAAPDAGAVGVAASRAEAAASVATAWLDDPTAAREQGRVLARNTAVAGFEARVIELEAEGIDSAILTRAREAVTRHAR